MSEEFEGDDHVEVQSESTSSTVGQPQTETPESAAAPEEVMAMPESFFHGRQRTDVISPK